MINMGISTTSILSRVSLLIATATLLLVGLPLESVKSVSAVLTPFGYTAYARFTFNTTRSPVAGIKGNATVETPRVKRREDYSYGGVGLVAVDDNDEITAFMDTGYIVYPARYGNSKPRFFVRYGNLAPDGTIRECFDVDCPGFVKARKDGGKLGTVLDERRTIQLSIIQERTTKNWVVSFEGLRIGHWPNSLFTGARKNGFKADAGGTVFDSTGDRTPPTQMGSGVPGILGREPAAYVTDIELTDASGRKITPGAPRLSGPVITRGVSTNPICYTVKYVRSLTNTANYYYGGPGCPI